MPDSVVTGVPVAEKLAAPDEDGLRVAEDDTGTYSGEPDAEEVALPVVEGKAVAEGVVVATTAATELPDEHFHAALGEGEAPEFIFLVGAGDQAPRGVEVQAIGAPCGFLGEGEFSLSGPLPDAIMGLIGEIDIACGVGRGSFGELEAVGEELHLGAVR